MARQTSINCYHEQVSKFMNKQEARIYNSLLELKEATRGEIAEHLKMEKSTVSARINNMIKYGILIETGKRKDKISGVTNYTVAINGDYQGRLF